MKLTGFVSFIGFVKGVSLLFNCDLKGIELELTLAEP